MPNSNATVTKLNESIAEKKPMSIEDLIRQSAKQLGIALPAHMRPERIVRIALTTLRTNPKLYECEPQSILAALFQSAQLGLEPNLNGEAWIIPYNVSFKRPDGSWGKKMMAQFQVGAQGWAKLYWNHMNSVSLAFETVREKDFFEYNLGTQELKHVPPPFGKQRGESVGYYAIANLTNGGRAIIVMSKEDAMTHAKRFSKCWDKKENSFMPGTPWREHFDAMAEKTVLVRLMKRLPKSVEIQQALKMDETIKNEIETDMASVPQSVDYADILAPDEQLEPAKTVALDTSKAVQQPALEDGKKDEATTEVAGNISNEVPILDLLESQLSELEVKGTKDDLKKWFSENSKKFAFLTNKDRAAIMKRYNEILKAK